MHFISAGFIRAGEPIACVPTRCLFFLVNVYELSRIFLQLYPITSLSDKKYFSSVNWSNRSDNKKLASVKGKPVDKIPQR